MEYWFGWTSNSPTDTETLESTRTTLTPPPFLSIHKTGRELQAFSSVALTPLESELKDLVVRLYSDKGGTNGNQVRPHKQARGKCSSPAEGGHLGSMSTQSAPVSAGSGVDHSGVAVVRKARPQRRSEGDQLSETESEDSTFEPKLVREALELSIKSTQRRDSSEGKKRTGAAKSTSLPPTPLAMSGSRSQHSKSPISANTALFSSFSVPTFFSADDKAVEAADPQFPPLASLGGLPYEPVDAEVVGDGQPISSHSTASSLAEVNLPLALRVPMEPTGQQFAVPTAEDPDTSFTWQALYSHSDSGRPRHSSSDSGGSKQENRTHLQVGESFKIEPEYLQQRTSPKHTPTSQLPPSSPKSTADRTNGGLDPREGSADHAPAAEPPSLLNPHQPQEKPPQPNPAFLPAVSVTENEDKDPLEHDPSSPDKKEAVGSLEDAEPTQPLPESTHSRSPSPELDDSETASVISIQQLTESLHNEPEDILSLADDFPHPITGTSSLLGGREDRDKTPTPSEASSTKSYSLPPSVPKPVSVTPSKYAPVQQQHQFMEPPSSPNLPKHLQPLPLSTYPQRPAVSPTAKRAIERTKMSAPVFDSQPSSHGDQHKSLETQLSEALQGKAHLEGQLESVVEECKATLKDRAALQSKLAKVEAELAEAMVRESAVVEPKATDNKHKEVEELRAKLAEVESALGREQKGALALKNELAKEKQQNRRTHGELSEAQRSLSAHKHALADLKEKDESLRAELERKVEENQELECELSSLQASYEALEGTKSWLHGQLQDSLQSKKKLQADLRHSKASGIAQGIKIDQLAQEREVFQKRIAELQQGVLEDKARLVSELETIEADVLSREGAFSQLISDKAQLEDMVKWKEKEAEKLRSELAETRLAKQELENQLSEIGVSQDDLTFKAGSLEQENRGLKEKLQALEHELDGKSSDVVELEKLKGTLQERLRQSEAALISKEGTLQGVNDAKEILKQELEMVKQGQDTAESELEEARRENGELEMQLKTAVDEVRGKEAKIRALAQAQQADAAEKQALQSQLDDRVAELAEKQDELRTIEQQSKDLMTQFKSLQDNFQAITSESSDTHDDAAEKDRVIAHLADEKERADVEIASLREKQDLLERTCQQLQQEKARLQGEMEALSGSSVEDLQRALQDKASLQAELNSLKVGHQNEMIKAKAKADRLESELKAAKRQAGKTEKELQKALEDKEAELRDAQELHAQVEASLRDASRKLKESARGKGSTEGALKALRDKVSNLESRNQLLTKHCEDLAEQLQHESSQRSEVERASGMVATKLKQNAEEVEKKMQDQVNKLSLEVERLRGRLAGMTTAQSTMREHAGSLEVALAERESSLIKLSAQAQKVLQEKEMEDQAFTEEIANLKRQLGALTAEVEKSRAEAASERKRADSLEEELTQRWTHEATPVEASSIQEELSLLSKAKDELQQEIGSLRAQLVIARTSAESAQRDLTNKNAQVEILKREVQMAEEQRAEASDELRQLQEHLRVGEEKRALEMAGLRRAAESSAVDVPGGYRPGVFDTSLSSIGLEETDRPLGMLVRGVGRVNHTGRHGRFLRTGGQDLLTVCVGNKVSSCEGTL